MQQTDTITINKALDPSRTLNLRNAFARTMRKRFGKLAKKVVDAIQKENVFSIAVNRTPRQGEFAAPRVKDKAALFMEWFEREIVLSILTVDNTSNFADNAWYNSYIQEAYKKGIMRARVQISVITSNTQRGGIVANARPRKPRRIPALSETGGVAASLDQLAHIERLSMLYARTFSELKGVTNAMSQLVTRVLSEGLLNGDGPRTIARKLNKVITGIGKDLSVTDSLGRFISAAQRAEMIARTEMIRAHAEAQLTEFEAWGVEGVTVKAELLTTKDERTCSRCSRLEKQVMTIAEARGVIPVHPRCRCIWVPFISKK